MYQITQGKSLGADARTANLIGVCWSWAGAGRAATVFGNLSRPLHSVRRDRAGIQSQVSIPGKINVDTPFCEQWARCSVCIPPQRDLTGTLEGFGAALDLFQINTGPAQKFWGSNLFAAKLANVPGRPWNVSLTS